MDSKKEILLKKAYDEYIDLMLYDFPIERVDELVAGDISGYGTTVDEKVLDINRLVKIVRDQREQAAGIEMHINSIPVHRRISPDEDIALYMDEFEITMVIDGTKNMIPLRLTSVFEFSENAWKLVHLHGSKAVETEGDTWHLNEWKKKNAELQKLVDEKTEDLSKKNRELEIEAALERVRARTMAMHNSDELAETAAILFQQMTALGVTPERINICLIKEADNILEVWATDQQGMKISHHFNASLDEPTTGKRVYKAWKEKKKSIIIDLSGKELDNWIPYVREVMGMTIKDELVREHRIHSVAFFSQGMILTTTPEPLPEESIKLLERFADVFNLTYRRFLDLQKAEAQAREAQIEAALEKVRSRSLAMHRSDELQDLVNAVFGQLKSLHIDMNSASIFIFEKGSKDWQQWVAAPETSYARYFHIPYSNQQIVKDLEKERQKGNDFFTVRYSFEEKNKWFDYAFKHTDYRKIPEKRKNYIRNGECMIISFALSKNTGIQITKYHGVKFSDKENEILMRIAKVFEQAYVRFLDLKKAEAQARESEIQLALERVRARTMAMQKSEELAETMLLLSKQLKGLGEEIDQITIGIFDEEKGIIETSASIMGNQIKTMPVPIDEPFVMGKFYQAWKRNEKSLIVDVRDKELQKYNTWRNKFLGKNIYPTDQKDGKWIVNAAIFSKGLLSFSDEKPASPETLQLLERFAAVFDLTYTRFLDLKNAEALAREAQIEASLERIRSHALGMQKSEEVGKVTDVFFAELTRLTVKIIGCSIVVIDEIKDSMEIWRARTNVAVKPFSRSSLKDALSILKRRTPEWYMEYEKGLKIKKGVSCEELTGEKRNRFLTAIAEQNHFSPEEKARYLKMMPEKSYTQFLYFKLGYLALISEEKLPEENLNIARRFTDVFDFAYTRFLDIKKAEEQAREAIKQAALDRIRGQIASMRNAEDLQQLTPLVWRELKTLEVPFFRCGIFIINEKKKNVDVYLTTPEGNPLAALHLAFNSNGLTSNTVASWKKKEVYQEHWNREEFIEWMHEMMKLRQVKAEQEYQGAAAPPDSLHLHFIPFAQGMLYVGNTEQLNDEKIELVKSLAEAFSFAYARYQDFVVLEEAKERVEKTLSDLKATQAQLIHSEKMASLGELTAGIAHEIQNPLNFVNNFSEVSADLIKELNEEIEKGDTEEVTAIAKDLLQNLEKINLHGKRASNIVKSMLEHSRAGSAEKQPTDLNALADEYLRLAYHGLRAKDKSFNADFKLEADPDLPKVNVVPQDFGRVLHNLINNAFFAVNERSKKGESWIPTHCKCHNPANSQWPGANSCKGQRSRHPRQSKRQDLSALLYHQAHRAGHRPGLEHEL